jgi:WD40 repeat protein
MRIANLVFSFLIVLSIQAQDDEYQIAEIKEHKGNVLSVAFSPDGQYLLSGSEDKVLVIYDLKLNEPVAKYTDNYFPPRAIVVTQMNTIFLGAGSDIKMIDMDNQTLAVYKGNSTYIWSISFAPERNKLVAGSYDYTIKVWDVATQEIELQLEGHKKSTLPVAFSPDEKYIVSGSLDRTVKIWNAKTGELMKTLEKHTDNIYDIAFHPTGKYFASASRDKTIRLWDFESGEVVMTYIGHDKGILDIEFTPDGNHLVSASFDGSIRLWQTKTGKMVYTFSGHEGIVNTIDINTDGTLLASGGEDTKVLIWELSKKIFVEYAYYDEFHKEMESSSIFDPKRKGERKEDYEKRQEKANIKEAEIIERYYLQYVEDIRNQTF